jgi:hypothetical protein
MLRSGAGGLDACLEKQCKFVYSSEAELQRLRRQIEVVAEGAALEVWLWIGRWTERARQHRVGRR